MNKDNNFENNLKKLESIVEKLENGEVDLEDTETIVYEYIDNVVTDLDKDRIKQQMSELMVEAQNMEIV